MSANYGWAGKILRVNLTTGSITTEDTAKYQDYIGGMGLAYKIMYDEVPLTTKAYDEANKIIFGVGPLTASGVPCSGRMNVTTLSAWTKGYSILDGHMGGHIAHNFKYAGYDALVIEGKAAGHVYIKIDDDKVTIESAEHTWGMGTFDTNRIMIEENGSDFDVVSIGQAGENLVNYSCMLTSSCDSAGAGTAAVLGSKNVKSVVVRGTGNVKIANPAEFKELCDYMLRELIGGNNNHNVPAVPQSWAEYSAPSGNNRWAGAPGRVWGLAEGGPIDMGEQPYDDINKIAYRCMKGQFDFGDIAQKYMVKVGGCSSCPVRCYAEYEMAPLAEYELPTRVSNTCMPIIYNTTWYPEGVKDFVDEGDASIIINGAGERTLDNFGVWENYGNLLREFNWCYKHGVFERVLPKEEYDAVPWDLMKEGNPKWMWWIIEQIATKKGEISHLGDGTYLLAERWNLGQEFWDDNYMQTISYNGYPRHHGSEDVYQVGVLYSIMYNRDCMIHHMINIVGSGCPYEVYKKTLEDEFGEGCVDMPKKYTPMNRSKARLAKWAFIGKQWHDSATVCNWMWPMTQSPAKSRNYKGDHDLDAKFMSAVTGEKWTRADVDLASERISNMLRVMTAISFNINEGSTNLREDHDTICNWVFDKEPEFKAFEEGTVKLDRADMELAKDMFYEEMGWDVKTGIPTRATLERVGLGYMADDLAARGLLPA